MGGIVLSVIMWYSFGRFFKFLKIFLYLFKRLVIFVIISILGVGLRSLEFDVIVLL